MYVMSCCQENNFSNRSWMWPINLSGTTRLVRLLSNKCVTICSTIAVGDEILPEDSQCLTVFNNIM